MSQLMQTVNFLKKNPNVVEKFLNNEVSLVGLNETQQQAVKNVFRQGVPQSTPTYW